jgi:CheY-like chemotaxis protein/two-component sensor histidine kinase
VDDLLDVTRIAQGKIVLQKERLELATLAALAVQTSEPFIKTRDHQLSVSLPTEPLWLEGDPGRLVQVLTNLLNNAAKYTELGGHIWLTGAREGAEAVIRIRDTGVGIPPEMLKRIFEPFTQVDRSQARSQGGLGIGLALASRLVALHGGRITAHSVGLGQGSEFVIRLPLSKVKVSSAQPTIPAAQPSTSLWRILLVEDNADGRETMKTLLRLWGHEVETAVNGREGLEKAASFHPQVALIDIGLPILDGFALAKEIRAAYGNRISLIALTGYGQEEDRRRTLEAGFDAHLVKPVDPEDLAKLLAELPRQAGAVSSR